MSYCGYDSFGAFAYDQIEKMMHEKNLSFIEHTKQDKINLIIFYNAQFEILKEAVKKDLINEVSEKIIDDLNKMDPFRIPSNLEALNTVIKAIRCVKTISGDTPDIKFFERKFKNAKIKE